MSAESTETGEKYEGFTLAMAAADAVPVLLFAASCVMITVLSGSAVFAAGAALCVCAGLGKVLWKVFLALRGRDIRLLAGQFRFLMPAGFILIILAAVLGRRELFSSELLSGLLALPQAAFFSAAAVLMAAMAVLGARLDAKSARANWAEQTVNIAAQACVLAGLIFLL
jgi:hypothetical protein